MTFSCHLSKPKPSTKECLIPHFKMMTSTKWWWFQNKPDFSRKLRGLKPPISLCHPIASHPSNLSKSSILFHMIKWMIWTLLSLWNYKTICKQLNRIQMLGLITLHRESIYLAERRTLMLTMQVRGLSLLVLKIRSRKRQLIFMIS